MFKGLIGLILFSLFGFFIFMKLTEFKKDEIDEIKEEIFSIDIISLEDLIIWFKKNINKEDVNLIPVLIKQNKYESISGKKIKLNNNYNISLVQCFFNKEKSILAEYRIIYCNSISKDLEKMFEAKDMLVFS